METGDRINIFIIDRCIVSNNTCASSLVIPISSPSRPPQSMALSWTSATPNHCSGHQLLTAAFGVVSDGSGNQSHLANQRCSWVLQMNDAAARMSNLQYELTILNLDLEPRGVSLCYDSVSIYAGSDSNAPLIGEYCGQQDSLVCASGICPNTNGTLVLSATVFLQFSTDRSDSRQGFEFEWSTVVARESPQVVFDDISSLLGFNLISFVNSSIGGAVVVDGSWSTQIIASRISDNTVRHWLSAAGGGVFGTDGASIRISNSSIISNNIAESMYAAVGGGVTMFRFSSVTLEDGSELSSNTARASGHCWRRSFGEEWNCPVALGGGGVAAGKNGLITISGNSASVKSNAAECLIDSSALYKQPCIAGGGGIAAIGSGSKVVVSNQASIERNEAARGGGLYATDLGQIWMEYEAVCWNNTAKCSQVRNASGCVASMGGCGFVDSGAIRVGSRAVVAYNKADEGGAMFITDDGSLTAATAIFERNHAELIGGALMAYSRGRIDVRGGVLTNNTAARATIMAGFNADGVSMYSFGDGVRMAGSGSLVIAVGAWTGLGNNSDTTWTCTHEGTSMQMDESSGGFFSMRCDACSGGSYAIGKAIGIRECLTCPFGALCSPSEENQNGLRALGGFWGRIVNSSSSSVVSSATQLHQSRDTRMVDFLACPPGYCCPMGRDCSYNYCSGGRIGRLCGRCPPGSGVAYFTTDCIRAEDCKDAGWAITLAVVGAVAMVLWLLLTTSRKSQGLLSVLLFFYQVSPVVKSSPWQHVPSGVIAAVQAIFAFSPPDVSASDTVSNSAVAQGFGVCIKREMTTSQKAGAKMLFQGLVMLCFLGVGVIHLLVHRIDHHRRIKLIGPRLSLYVPALVRFMSIAYLTLVLVPLQMVQCVRMDGKSVWWWDAEIACYEEWQIAAFVGLSVLIPLPSVVIWMTGRRTLMIWSKKFGKKSEEAIMSTKGAPRTVSKLRVDIGKLCIAIDLGLCASLREERRWWLGVSLYRRLVVALIYSVLEDLVWRSIAMTAVCSLFLFGNLRFAPFKSVITHRAETLCMVLLCFLSATTAPQLSQAQLGSLSTIAAERTLEVVQITIISIPIALYLLFGVLRVARRAKANYELRMKSSRLIRGPPTKAADATNSCLQERELDTLLKELDESNSSVDPNIATSFRGLSRLRYDTNEHPSQFDRDEDQQQRIAGVNGWFACSVEEESDHCTDSAIRIDVNEYDEGNENGCVLCMAIQQQLSSGNGWRDDVRISSILEGLSDEDHQRVLQTCQWHRFC